MFGGVPCDSGGAPGAGSEGKISGIAPGCSSGVPPVAGWENWVSALASVYRPDGVELWMRSPHRSFGGLSAEELIARGRADEVLAEIERLTTGAFG